MKAREMFEELGYKYTYLINHVWYDDKVYYYVKELDEIDCNRVWFFLHKQEYSISKLVGTSTRIDIKLHQAIHQQMKELGWLE